jgi:hypothetical protein
VFGKANSSAINLSAIADASNPTGGFVINGEARYDYSGSSLPVRVSSPAPATKISSLLVPVSVLAFLSPKSLLVAPIFLKYWVIVAIK